MSSLHLAEAPQPLRYPFLCLSRVLVGGGNGGWAGEGYRRSSKESGQLHGADTAVVPGPSRAAPPGPALGGPRPVPVHLGRDLPPVPPPRLRPRLPFYRSREHGLSLSLSLHSSPPPFLEIFVHLFIYFSLVDRRKNFEIVFITN